MNPLEFSPKETLKSRRPERFSDSFDDEEELINRSHLEYHLDTLTSRSQEAIFEIFARHLAEREICPNLLPQTGPTGGGDSKVDSETFPVSEKLSLTWLAGNPDESADRWAFAFSAKKDWVPKVRSDIEKISKTKRNYRKAFFISNQYIRDKKRAEIEDELTKKFGLDVRILDRTWILDRVFAGHHEDLAIKDLDLKPVIGKTRRVGPLDSQRNAQLEKAEARIREATRSEKIDFSTVEDCIESALLAKELERPITEVLGHFTRAKKVARKHGTRHQQLTVAYQQAWCAFWWHEEYEDFIGYYLETEELVEGSTKVFEIELLFNLWNLVNGLMLAKKIDSTDDWMKERTYRLMTSLDTVSADEMRPSNALHASMLKLLGQLVVNRLDAPKPVFIEIIDVANRCHGLLGFPFEKLLNLVSEIGTLAPELPGFDDLFDQLVEINTSRKGDVSGARMLVDRGVAKLKSNNPNDAIRFFGRAFRKLGKDECRHDLVKAL
ncbi:MAG: hypothetical protein P1V19_26095, partial [Gimesia sp.]|nr:hypothetical protein [Gimesia sp.]